MLRFRIRPLFRGIRLFTLHVRDLTKRMFLAGYAKQQRTERKRDDALPGEKSHIALAHLSASDPACKDESTILERDHSLLVLTRARSGFALIASSVSTKH